MEPIQPTEFTPREYQTAIMEQAMQENIIVYLPTGAGKTYIATLLIKRMCGAIKKPFTEGGKRSFFLVNTVQLVEQQAQAIKQSTPLRVGEYSSDKGVDKWTVERWHQEFDTHEILVMTAQIYLDIVRHNFLKIEESNLLIFDECHAAVSSHPMRQIMTLFESCPMEKQPRVLGLTATLLNASCKVDAVDDEITQLERTFHSKIVSFVDDEQVLKFSTNPKEAIIFYPEYPETNLSKYCKSKIMSLIDKMALIQFEVLMVPVETPKDYSVLHNKEEKPRKSIKNVLEDLLHCLADMSIYGLYLGALAQIVRLERMKLATTDGFFYNIINVCVTELILIRKIISDHIDEKDYDAIRHYLSPKVLKITERLKNFDTDSALIFVERRFTAKVLCFLIKTLVDMNPNLFEKVKIDFVIGSTNTNIFATYESIYARKVNAEVIERFYKKKINVLIATNVLEEGTDIPLCNLVIKYDDPKSFRSYIQSKGRARSKDSWYYLMIEEKETEKFQYRYAAYKNLEKKLKEILLRGRQQPSEEDIESDLYKDVELPPFMPLGPEGPKVTMVGAPSLVNRYVQSLPQDKFSNIIPIYFVKSEGEGEDEKFTVQLQLPSNCPIKKLIMGPTMLSTKSAKQGACLEACKLLYEAGEFNEHLLPRGSKSVYLEDPNWFPHWIDEDLKEGQPEPGTSKNVRMHEKKYSSTLEDCQPQAKEAVYLHVFEITPKFELSPEDDTQRRRFYLSILKKSNTFGILTNKPIPQVCDFPLFISLGEMEVKMKCNILLKPLSQAQMEKLHKFHCLLFMQVLDVVKSFMISNMGESKTAISSYMVCPVNLASDIGSYVIDWDAVNNYQERFSELHEVSDKDRKTMQFDYQSLEGSLIIPWYRGYNISKQSYIVTRIAEELNPLSQFPSYEYQSYSEYFKEKYSKTIYHQSQHLVDVYPINSKLNCIIPRLRTAKRKKIDTDRERMEETLVPELCVEVKFPTAYWIKAIFLPSALHRLNRLLVAEELRLKIVEELRLGAKVFPADEMVPLSADQITVQDLPNNFETPSLPVSTVINSYERSVTEWKAAKRPSEFPFLDSERPIDLDRRLNDVSLIDIKNHVNLMDKKGGSVKSGPCCNNFSTANSQHSPHFPARSTSLTAPRLSLLDPEKPHLGPQQCEILQCITAQSAQDIQNYEYLETLGDSFLKFAVSLSLFLYCDRIDEGKLTRLKGKLLGNRNLFYCAKNLELASLLEVYNFSPTDDWIPPRFGVEQVLHEVMRESKLPPEGLFQFNFTEEEQISGEITEKSDEEMQLKLIKLSSAAEKDEPRGRSSTSITYLNCQEVSDKCVADCVEALLGIYVKKNGIQDAFKLLLYFGILPHSIIRYDLVFDETFCPPVCMNEAADSPKQVQFLLEESCYEILERRIGYKFNDKRYILQALSHTSFTQNNITECYQRLEFLGDAILDFLITCYIFETGKNLTPGQVTDVRSALVNNVTFACLAVRYNMHKSLLCRSVELQSEISKFASLQESKNHKIGEEVLILLTEKDCMLAESVDVPKVLGDLFESIAGAIYLDSGKDLKTVWRVYYNLMHNEIHEFCSKPPKNIVRKLYELNIDARFLPLEPLPDCVDVVMVPLEVRVNNEIQTVYGFGRNKSSAKKSAAKIATTLLANSD